MSTVTPALQDFLPAARRHCDRARLVAEYCAFALERVPLAERHDAAAILSMMCERTSNTDSLLDRLGELLVKGGKIRAADVNKAKNDLIREALSSATRVSLDAPIGQSDDAFIEVITPVDLHPAFNHQADDPEQILLDKEADEELDAALGRLDASLQTIREIAESLDTRVNTQRELRNSVLYGLSVATEFHEHCVAALELWVVQPLADAMPKFHDKRLRETVRKALLHLKYALSGDPALYIQQVLDDVDARTYMKRAAGGYARAALPVADVAETHAHAAEPILVPDAQGLVTEVVGDPESVAQPDAVAEIHAHDWEPILVPDTRGLAAPVDGAPEGATLPTWVAGAVQPIGRPQRTVEVSGRQRPWQLSTPWRVPTRARAAPHRSDTSAVQTWLGGVGSSGRSPPWQHSPPSWRAPAPARAAPAPYCARPWCI